MIRVYGLSIALGLDVWTAYVASAHSDLFLLGGCAATAVFVITFLSKAIFEAK